MIPTKAETIFSTEGLARNAAKASIFCHVLYSHLRFCCLRKLAAGCASIPIKSESNPNVPRRAPDAEWRAVWLLRLLRYSQLFYDSRLSRIPIFYRQLSDGSQERIRSINKNTERPDEDATLAKLLSRKRAELAVHLDTLRAEAGGIESTFNTLRAAIGNIESALASIDGTLRLMNPTTRPVALPEDGRPARAGSRFAQGECLALMKQILSESFQPLTTMELTRAVMVRKNLPERDVASVRSTVRRILRSSAAANVGIVATDHAAQYLHWKLRS